MSEETDRNEMDFTAAGATAWGDRLRRYAAGALRYWEPRRAIYNAALAGVVVVHFITAGAPYAKLTLDTTLLFFFLAVMANVLYCAAYPVDLFVQFAGLETAWAKGRVVLLAIGTAFAGVIAHFMIMSVFAGK